MAMGMANYVLKLNIAITEHTHTSHIFIKA